MFATAYIHMGLHKTGSTSFQALLFNHRESLLADCSTCYPSLQANLSRPLYSAFCLEPLAYPQNILVGIDSDAAVAADRESTMNALSREFEASSAASLVLSGEDLSHFLVEEWQAFCDWLSNHSERIIVSCVVREPVSWSRSNAQSVIRGGASLDDINRNPPLPRIRDKLSRAIEVVGRENVRVFNYDELCNDPNGLMAGLAQTFGINADWITGLESPRRNTSMTMEAARLISALNNEAPLLKEGRLGEGRTTGDVQSIINETAGEPFQLDPGADDLIRAASKDDIDWLAEEFDIQLIPTLTTSVGRENSPVGYTFSQSSIDSLALQLADRERVRRNNATLTNQVHAQTEKLEAMRSEGQTLRREIREQTQALKSEQETRAELEQHAHNLKENLADREAALQSILDSTSWRITAPLRWVLSRLRKG